MEPAVLIYQIEDQDETVKLVFPISKFFFIKRAPFVLPRCTAVAFRHELCGQSAWGYFRGCDPAETSIVQEVTGKAEPNEWNMSRYRWGPEKFGPLRDAIKLDWSHGHVTPDALCKKFDIERGCHPA